MVQLNKEEIIKITKRLQSVRQGLVQKAPFYAVLLFGLRFSLDDMVERVYTDGERIAFNPDFLKEVSDRELEFIMLHEVSHVALGHPFRAITDYDIEIFDEACDIVVNSNIYHYMGDDESAITIRGLGVMPHKNYNGQEGYKFTVEQVYNHLFAIKGKKKKDETDLSDSSSDFDEEDFDEDDELDTIEEVDEEDSNDDTEDDDDGCAGANGGPKKSGTKKAKDKGLGNSFAKALKRFDPSKMEKSKSVPVRRFDDHSFWKGQDEKNISKTIWENRVLGAYETAKNIKRISIADSRRRRKGFDSVPCFAERIYKEISERKLDWKTLLNDFIQEDICDYSFSPPDRRFGDSDFFLPDFNEKEEKVENLLFMIDTSGSMSDEQIGEVYSEIKGAIDQFNGKLKGWLGFFDAQVTKPKEFEDENEFKAIRIQGGGGTAFLPIFNYVRDHMRDKKIASIIILTDGDAPYPEEHERMGIPVLWVINNDDITPPWGMIARIPHSNEENY